MNKLSGLGAVVSFVFLLGGSARADDAVVPSATEWQTVIASQIQAFRDHDAPGALSFASEDFRKRFTDPKEFFITIISSGYSPIMESRSQTFGAFQMTGTDEVLQEVKLTGNDQSIYEAFYQLSREAEGWRVHAVQLLKTTGLGV